MNSKLKTRQITSMVNLAGFSFSGILKNLHFSNIMVATVTSIAAVYCGQLKTSDTPLDYIVFLFCSTLFVYTWDRRKINLQDEINKPERSHWLKKNHTLVNTLTIVSFVFCSFTFFRNLHIYKSCAVLSLLFICLIYGCNECIKKYAGVKNIILASTWAFSVIILPDLWQENNVSSSKWNLMAIMFLIAFANSLLFDLLDFEGDKIAERATIPTRYGQRTSSNLIFFTCLLLFALCLTFKYYPLSLVPLLYLLAIYFPTYLHREIVLDLCIVSPILFNF
jgi:4-hydroxybenzoate polyprenyltransferase